MFLRRTTVKYLGMSLLSLVLAFSGARQHYKSAIAQDQTDRSIVPDEFLKRRPRSARSGPRKLPSTYRLAKAATKQSDQQKLQVGVTIWKFEPGTADASNGERSVSGSYWNREDWIPKRVEADVKFRGGDTLRISIESPRSGYLYVVNRDWLTDGRYGEANLIFPTLGEDNQLRAGKLIDIPNQSKRPFKASPKPDQSSELLTIILTSSPLPLPLGPKPIPISEKQLRKWEEWWGGEADRLEMNDGAGQARTMEEQLAASDTRTRQLTREDPMPQTIYSVVPKNPNGLLFNLALNYVR